MQLTIKNTHIFDIKVQDEFRKFIVLHKEKIDASKIYELKIIYNSNSVLDRYEDKFYFDNSIYKTIELKFKKQNKKDEAINIQIDQCIGILKDYGIECYNSRIEGHKLNNNNIEIILEEDKSELLDMERKISKGKIGVTVIIPNISYAERKMGELCGKMAAQTYLDLHKSIGNEMMCEILGMQNTGDDSIIWETFIKEYGDLFFSTEDKHKKSKEKFLNRVSTLIEIERKKGRGHDNV
ncbi:hypothetical protein [Candidatus Clostridium helianthi]|uniref:CYTH domain-containing protein n=1 Tax=Candidatus Clostridium helianthi TaxID=3381660 RepID=A0ABW8S371_9CLOT